jgi:hypothetical protein
MSRERRRGLMRLAILLGSALGLAILGWSVTRGGGGSSTATSETEHAPARLTGRISRARLPVPLHGLTAAPTVNGVLAIGGADSGDRSKNTVFRLNPPAGTMTPAGSVARPVHDAAAATLNRVTMVFGGGDTTQYDSVQELTPNAPATTVGRMPQPLSDLSAVPVGGAIYLIGGFNGKSPTASVLQTTDGKAFTRVARLPTPVRYAAVAATQDKIYVFGGELANGQDTNEIQEYDIATEKAVVAGHLVVPVSHASAVTLDRAIYLLGGRKAGAASDQILRFDPVRNIGLPAGRLPVPVYDGAAAAYRGGVYLIGGLGARGTSLDSVIALR